jgi:hypothetical protein
MIKMYSFTGEPLRPIDENYLNYLNIQRENELVEIEKLMEVTDIEIKLKEFISTIIYIDNSNIGEEEKRKRYSNMKSEINNFRGHLDMLKRKYNKFNTLMLSIDNVERTIINILKNIYQKFEKRRH